MSTDRGFLYDAMCRVHSAMISSGQWSRRGADHDGLNGLAPDGIGHADDGDLLLQDGLDDALYL